MSPTASTLVPATGRAIAGAREPTRVTVMLRDGAGRALNRHLVRLDYSGAGLVQPAEMAVLDGLATFEVSAPSPTSGQLRATVNPGPGEVVLQAQPALSFVAGFRVGGTVSGLDRAGLVLASPGLPDLAVPAGAGQVAFGDLGADGTLYEVTVIRQPHGLVCTVGQGRGTLAGADVTNVAVACGQGWAAVSAGRGWHVVALKSDGSLWAWGGNEAGQVGDGTSVDRYLPERIGQGTNWKSISTGMQFSQAIQADGSRWSWGLNSGQYGDGTFESALVPRRASDSVAWATVSAGPNHALGLDAQGRLRSWGFNYAAQLGDGTTTDREAPVEIGGEAVWASTGAGWNTSHAIRGDGTLWGWGANQLGLVGDGAPAVKRRLAPAQVGADADWVTAASGEFAALGLKRDGTLWEWGTVGCGGGGFGVDAVQWAPTRLGSDSDWRAIDVGDLHCAALKADGSLWVWGMNPNGQLGLPLFQDAPAPRQLGSRRDWVSVAAGATCTFAIGRGGDLWAWGTGCLGWPVQREAPTYLDGVEIVAPPE